ncbi:MAG: hypothetical protein M1832_002104 [Thelocarpon impressellum]|nr:MAG: hypothetical protein M1832_002104 [Thelocarpon impressellum]
MPNSTRKASGGQAQQAGARAPSVTLLLTNLRLLNLDLHPDWPDITVQIFTKKNAKQDEKARIGCVEWVLCTLFEMWDEVCGTDKAVERLQPFFPALEPLQSVNLHAGLFRWISELKKDGVLGRDVHVRKGMLEECAGENMEKVLLGLSTAVLRKRLPKEGHGATIGQRLATADSLSQREQALLEPLILTHRASLTRKLHGRCEQTELYKEFQSLLRSKHTQIARRQEELLADHQKQQGVPAAEAEALRRRFEDNWLGDPAWLDVLLQGYHQGRSDPLLVEPFDSVWRHVESGTTGSLQVGAQRGLLEELESRVRTQKSRIEQWKAFQPRKSLRQVRSGETLEAEPVTPPRSHAAHEDGNISPVHSVQGDAQDNSDWDTASDEGEPDDEASGASEQEDMNVAAEVPPVKVEKRPPLKSARVSLLGPEDREILAEQVFISSLCTPIALSHAQIVSSVTNSDVSPEKARGSLADRARMSMAMARGNGSSDPYSTSSTKLPRESQPQAISTPPVESKSFAGLVDRTRQSMSTLPPAKSRRLTQNMPKKASYPTNQFTTPSKAPATPSTPPTHEELLAQEADYDAVFRSRPKIKLSPVASPERDGDGGGGGGEGDERLSEVFEDADEDEDEMGGRAFESSPLGRMGVGMGRA